MANQPSVAIDSLSGMLREWKFKLHLAHKAARVKLQYVPRWEALFIDPDEFNEGNAQSLAPLRKFFAFRDLKAAIRDGEHWEELPKEATCFYAPGLTAKTSLKDFCKYCIRSILTDPKVNSIDNDTNLKKLTIGTKLQCPYQLGGHPTFHFEHVVSHKASLTQDHYYNIGCVVGETGYLVSIRCSRRDELLAYATEHFLSHASDPEKLQFNVPVTYAESTHHGIQRQQELFGELQYMDGPAATYFSVPMYPMLIRPDFSPTQSLDVGSTACLTLEISVYQKVVDDLAEREVTGMPKYKANGVLLLIEVEDVARNGFGSLLSIDEYSRKKTNRIQEAFQDTKIVGPPLSLNVGNRCGRSSTVTFTYVHESGRVTGPTKSMLVSTLMGNRGITATYFTKMGQGLFDAHLFIYHQLLRNMKFFEERDLLEAFSRHKTTVIRLTPQDIDKAYVNIASPTGRGQLQQHMKDLMNANEGRADGSKFVKVQPSSNEAAAEEVQPAEEAIVEDDEEAKELRRIQEEEMKRVQDELDSKSEIWVGDIEHLSTIEEWEKDEIDETKSEESKEGEATTSSHASPIMQEPSSKDVAADQVEQKPGSRQGGSDSMATPITGDGKVVSPIEGSPEGKGTEKQVPSQTKDEHEEEPETEVRIPTAAEVDEVTRKEEEEGTGLRELYVSCCDLQRCKPNSYLLKKLPDNPSFTNTIQELDMSSNYLGHNGFVAVLYFLGHLPKVHTVHFNEMSLDNSDVSNLCEILVRNSTVTGIQLRNNPKITLPSTKHLFKLIRANPKITHLSLSGTKIGQALIDKIEKEAEAQVKPV